MKCPACFNDLTQMQVGSVVVDVCHGGCGGIWFDAFELQRVDEVSEEAGERLVEIDHDPNIQLDMTHKRECPKCDGVKLKRHYFSAKRRVEVDECPNCGGYWLDAGELAQIRAERSEQPQLPPGARPALTSEAIRYLYRLRTGQPET